MPAQPNTLVNTRKARSDSLQSKLQANSAGLQKDVTISWPDTARTMKSPEHQQRAEVLFGELVTARPTESWQRSDLVTLSEYCRLSVLTEDMTEEVASGNHLQLNQFGFESARPVVQVLAQMNARRAAIWTGLRLGELTAAAATLANALANKQTATAIAKASDKAKGLLA